jgi:7-carboxy-7-deazaguanine synthase
MRAKRYTVKSIFLTLQGEGHNAGRRAVFCRFTGCNLWNGREVDRGGAICQFCDTDFVGTDGPGGGVYMSPTDLAEAILGQWSGSTSPFVVFTGGEPTLQLDHRLVDALHAAGAEIAIETNGTRPVVADVDWICVSPKAGAPLRQVRGDEIKIAWPQAMLDLDSLERLDFRYRFLQPIDGLDAVANTRLTVATCRERPAWNVSLQFHKIVGIP